MEMENGGGLFTNAKHQRGQNGNNSNYGLLPGSWVDLGTSTTTRRRTSGSYPFEEPPTPAATPSESSGVDAAPPMYEFRACHHYIHPFYHHPPPPYSAAGGGADATHRHLFPDPHFFDLASPHHLLGGGHMVGLKRGRSDLTGGGGAEQPRSLPAAAVARCQVDGCHAALDHAKEYHRRHKVCEMHSKAPKVVLLGADQRFCQQCSRFHAVTEFDDTKRSCRRRLAGHNQRRRKTSPHDSTNPSQDKLITGDRCSYLSTSPGRARSLLSSKADSWVSESDLSSRSSAALRELIEENRAAVLARQLILDGEWQCHHRTMDDIEAPVTHDVNHPLPEPPNWDRFHEAAHVTLDLMQGPGLVFGSSLLGESPIRHS